VGFSTVPTVPLTILKKHCVCLGANQLAELTKICTFHDRA